MDTSAHPNQPVPFQFAPPAFTLKGVLFVGVCWLVYSTLYSIAITAGEGQPFLYIFFGQVVSNFFMALLSIGPWWLIVRGMDGRVWWQRLLAHAIALPIYVFLGGEAILAFAAASPDPHVQEGIKAAYPFILAEKALGYGVQFALFHMVLFFQRMRAREQQATQLLALAKERELMALRTQINPHFLFNTLNAISALAGEDAEATRQMVARLADMMRYALDSSRQPFVLLEEELSFAEAYLEIERRRLGSRLQVHVEVPAVLRTHQVPAVIIQPLVENAVKHGIAPSEKGGTISLLAKMEGASIQIEVRDDGSAGGKEQGTGVGLTNIRERLKHHYGEQAMLRTEALHPHGFSASLILPIDPAA